MNGKNIYFISIVWVYSVIVIYSYSFRIVRVQRFVKRASILYFLCITFVSECQICKCTQMKCVDNIGNCVCHFESAEKRSDCIKKKENSYELSKCVCVILLTPFFQMSSHKKKQQEEDRKKVDSLLNTIFIGNFSLSIQYLMS